MPSKTKFLVGILVVLMLAVAAYPQAQTVYVSGGPNIYAVFGGTATLIYTNASANFESLAIGPDNADIDGLGNAKHPVLLYACDPAGNIIRLDPAQFTGNPAQTPFQSVASGLAIAPVCGRSVSTEDFYVTDKNPNGILNRGGVFKLNQNNVPLANVPYTSTAINATATAVSGTTPGAPRGITQKYIGDPLVVDNAGNQVLRAAYANLALPPLSFSTFISNPAPPSAPVLSSPVGLARASTGEVFVSNSVSKIGHTSFSPVVHFKRDGSPASAGTCPVLNFSTNTTQVPSYLATAPTDQFPTAAPNTVITDTIYLVSFGSSKGTLWSWNTASAASGNCSLNPVASVSDPLTGVAIAPAPVTLALVVSSPNASSATPTPTVFDFHSNQFWLTANGCTANVTATALIPATVNEMISLSGTSSTTGFPDGATPSPGLGDQGYEIVWVAHWLAPSVSPACTSVFSDGGFLTTTSALYDSTLNNNPRTVRCDNGDPSLVTQSTEPQIVGDSINGVSGPTTCMVTKSVGVYPGGPIPADGTRSSTNSVFTDVNAGLTATEPGQFCGFQSPLTGDGTTLPSPPPSFSAGATTTVNVKFKLATASGSCKNGPYITDAQALLSVARNADSTGTFKPINVQATSSSIDQPPIFPTGNQQYSFTLNLPSIFAQAGAGTYTVTVTFLSDNTTYKTTLFTLTP